MTIEKGESSSKVIVLRTKAIIKEVKDKDKDIKITINNNLTLN
jgi:hypothetical protein